MRVREQEFTLAEAFKKAGRATAAFSESPYIIASTGFDEGFDTFNSHEAFRRNERNPRSTLDLMEDAKSWIVSNGDRPWFGYVHLLRPHSPYDPPDPYLTRFAEDDQGRFDPRKELEILQRSRGASPVSPSDHAFMTAYYDGNLHYADRLVGEFIELLRSEKLLEKTLVIITSDHGEAFMQHGRFGHGFRLYEELLHVPLIFVVPNLVMPRRNSSSLHVEMIDVYPTLVDIFDLEPPYEPQGRSLLPVMLGEKQNQKQTTYAQTMFATSISTRIGQIKVISHLDKRLENFDHHEVYDLEKDPGETSNVFSTEKDIQHHLAKVRQFVQDWLLNETLPASTLSDEEIENLESLGYLQ